MASRRDLANAIRALSMDAVQQANSGHPGAPMGMADIAEVLWNDYLTHNPADPEWSNRDRFVLSNGHGSMLLYSLLHLSGYNLPIEEKTFDSFIPKLRVIQSMVMHPVWRPPPDRWDKASVMPSVWRSLKRYWPRNSTVLSTVLWIITHTHSWAMVA